MAMNKMLGRLMGIIILLADLYWIYLAWGNGFSSYNEIPIVLGVIILIADLVWLAVDK